MTYEFEKTPNYRFQYNKLPLKMKRFVEEALDIIQASPTEFQGRIRHLSDKKDHRMFRYRIPGAYLIYLVPNEGQVITLMNLKKLR